MQHKPTEKTLLQKTWFRLLTGGILFIAILLFILPIAGKYYCTNWLLENGADTAVIKNIRFNPFKAQVSLDGVDVTIGETTVLSDATIVVNVGLMSILNKQANIEETTLQDVTLDLELLNDGSMRIASYTTAPPVPETQTVTKAKPSLSWVVLAQHVSISNCTVHFKMPDMDITLLIDEALLTDLSTEPGASSGTFSFKGSVNGTPVVFDLKKIGIMPDLSAQGTVKIDSFALDNLADVLKPYVQPFTGLASVDGDLKFRMTPSMDIYTDYNGMISLENGHIAGDSFSVQGAPVRWEQGTIHFEMTEQKGIFIDVDGSLTGKNLTVDIPDPVINIQEPDLAINGKVQVAIDDEIQVATCAGFTLKHTTFVMPPLAAESSSIRWQGRDQCIHFNSGTADKALSVQAQGKLSVEAPSFSDQDQAVQLAVNGTSLSWDGQTSYRLGLNEQVPSTVQTNGKLTGNGLNLTLADTLSYKQDSLAADGQSSVNLTAALKVTYAGALDLKGTELMAAGVDTTVEKISWASKNSGSVTFTLADDSSIHLALNGDLQTQGVQAELVESGLLLTQQELTISANGTLLLGQETNLKGTSSLTLNGFALKENNSAPPLVTLGSFSMDSIEAPGGQKVKIKQAALHSVSILTPGEMPLKASISNITLNDIHTDDLKTFTTETITAQKPKVVSLKNNRHLAGLNSLEINTVEVSLDQQVTVKQVNFDDLFFLGESVQKDDNVCRLDSARLSDIGWNPEQGVKGRSLSFAGLFCTLIREKNGSFALSKKLAAMSNAEPGGTEKDAQETKKKESNLKINLEQITLRGDSGLHIEDQTLAVPYVGDWDITTLQIKNLNSTKPEAPASLKMVGLLNGRAPIKIKGTVNPFLDPLAMDMKIKLKNYPLVRLSPYSVQSVGVALAAGELKVKSTIKINDNKLDMENDVLIKKLETSTLSKELADKLNNQLPIPLDSALSLLRDSDDNIHLNIPLKGPLGELNVGVSDVLITALSKAIVPAASGYLMYTLGPYGALAWVGMKVGEKMLQIKLPPVEFPPGKSKLAKDVDDYFSRLAKILKEKPDADYQLCPQSSAWEFVSDSEKEKIDEKTLKLSEQDRTKLMKLGQERAQNIKDYLVDKYQIDKDRLLICVSKVDMKKSAQPRVNIHM